MTARHFILSFLLALLTTSVFSQTKTALIVNPIELIDKADVSFENGNLKKADSLYAGAIKFDLSAESSSRLAINYARTLIEMSSYDSALSIYTYGLYADSTNDYLWFLRGELLGKYLKNAAGAAGDISMAIELNGEQSIYYESRGLAFDAMKNFPAAERDFSKMIELNDVARNYTSRALFYLRRGKLKEALADADKAIEKDELYTWSYIAKGQILAQMSENGKACEAFRKANDMGNNSDQLMSFLSNCN